MMEEKQKQLEQNLVKRNELLDSLNELSDRLNTLLDTVDMEAEAFDVCMDEQDELVKKLTVLTEEAEVLCAYFQQEKDATDSVFVTQPELFQALLAQITGKTNSLQEKEQSIKQKLAAYFESERKLLGSGRRSSKAALDYYKSMNRSNVVSPQFMDKKK